MSGSITPSDPLSRFQFIETENHVHFRDALIERLDVTDVRLEDPTGFRARSSVASLADIELLYSNCATRVVVDHREMDWVRLLMGPAAEGRALVGRRDVSVQTSQFGICPAGVKLRLDGRGPLLTLRVKPQALVRRVIAMTGMRPRTAIEFDSQVDQSHPAARLLQGLVLLLAQELNDAPTSPAMVRGLEDLIVAALLRVSRLGWTLGDADAARGSAAQARLAADYIAAHLEVPLTLEDLAAITDISTRSLFRAFKKLHGCSPMAFAKQCRLLRTRELLSDPDPATTVTGVALRYGFSNLGHFAKDYASMFGELPSETLRAARRTDP